VKKPVIGLDRFEDGTLVVADEYVRLFKVEFSSIPGVSDVDPRLLVFGVNKEVVTGNVV